MKDAQSAYAQQIAEIRQDSLGDDPRVAPSDDDDGSDGGRPTQSQQLVALSKDADLFCTSSGKAFATVRVEDHYETHAIRGGSFRRWLGSRFFASYAKPPGSQALQDTLGTLEARAQFEGEEQPVYVRVATLDGTIYVDLGNNVWDAVEINSDGWSMIETPPVKFRRAPGMKALPIPTHGATVNALRQFVNVDSDDDFRLVVAFALTALRPTGPYPILVLLGEQGSAKTTTARVLRALLDPSSAPVRSRPREERDLVIAANNSWVLAFDNLSGIHPWLSDALCRLSTGGGFSTRALYTDDEEAIFDAQRPVIINGIDDMADRDDLRDRAIMLTLPQITDTQRKDEETFWQEFHDAQPALLGAFFTVISGAIRAFPDTKLTEAPRMADFARWVVSAESTLGWPEGAFIRAYTGNRDAAIEKFVEDDRIASEIRLLVEEGEWTGTATELLDTLNSRVDEKIQRLRDWPKSPRALSGHVRRAAPALRRLGYGVIFGHAKQRFIKILPADDRQASRKEPERTVDSVDTVKKANGNDDDDGNDGSSTHYSDLTYEQVERRAIQEEGAL